MALPAGYYASGGHIFDQEGRRVVIQAAGGAPLDPTYYKSGGKIYDANGMEVVIVDNATGGGGGSGLPAGGVLGQQVIKQSSTNGDALWESGAHDPIASGNGSTAYAASAATAPVHLVTLNAASCALTFSGAATGRATTLTLALKQDATGGRLVTWPGSVSWGGGLAPTLSTAGDAIDVITLMTVDAGVTWLGFASTAGGSSSASSVFSGAKATTSGTVLHNNATVVSRSFNQEVYDIGGWHDTATNNSRLTVPTGKAGIVRLVGHAVFDINATGIRQARIRKNNTTDLAIVTTLSTGSTLTTPVQVTVTDQAAVADYYELQVYQDSGGQLNTTGLTWFAVEFCGPVS